jgi:hypothetical protein
MANIFMLTCYYACGTRHFFPKGLNMDITQQLTLGQARLCDMLFECKCPVMSFRMFSTIYLITLTLYFHTRTEN